MNAGSAQTPGPHEQSTLKRAGAWALYLFRPIFTLASLLTSTPYRINGASMGSTLRHGDCVLVSRMTAWLRRCSRGSVVVLRSPRGGRTTYVKRIVGIPNETLRLDDGRVLADGCVIEEPYLNIGARTEPKSAFTEWFLDPDEYFVLGDCRSDSDDSRAYGTVKWASIIGRVWLRYWPLRRFGLVRKP